ncbi:MAG TPA: hypothetical protein VFK88_07510 [Gallionella sp.]|nr:hypothetical protein [Gallionella sp.]
MLCTLDNFIKVILFHERIFLTDCAGLMGTYLVPRKPRYGANETGRNLFDEAKIFFPEQQFDGYLDAVEERVTRTLDPVDPQEYPLFIIQCELTEKNRTLLQEMPYLDAYFIEYAIEQYGADRFKAVFPGEHLYLGLRHGKVPVLKATSTLADIPGRRFRAIIGQKVEQLAPYFAQRTHLLPALPPVFVSRVLRACSTSADFVPTLLKIRHSAALKDCRSWLIRCHELAQSADSGERQKAAAAFEKLNEFLPVGNWAATKGEMSLLEDTTDIAAADPAAIVPKLMTPIAQFLADNLISEVQQLVGKPAEPEILKKFFKDHFGEHFSRHEMSFVSTLLKLPDSLTGWRNEEALFRIYGVTLNEEAPALARPCFQRVEGPAYSKEALMDFDELFSR